MNIRCEKCSTTYELDEKLLAPEGSPVQCTKCQHVFTAVPPRAAGRTLVGVPAAPPPQPVAAPRAPAASPEPQAGGARQGPAIYRPSHAAAAPVARPPRPRRDTMGAFEARLKANARLRWLIPLAVAAVAVVAVVGYVIFSGGVDPAAKRRHAEAMALVSLDDLTSLERASQLLDELARQKAGIDSIGADRALAQLLLATGLLEDVAPQADRLARKVAERDRAAAAQAAPEALKALSAEVEALRVQVEPRQAKARALSDQAYATLKKLAAEQDGVLEVARALAIHFASIGDREQALRFIRASAGARERDPWIRLAEAWLDAREEGKEARERAVSKLTALVAAHPQIVRARFLLAETQAALGRREQAAATLDGLLAANPGHNRARRVREELVVSAPAPQAPAVAPKPIAPPAPGAAPMAPAAPRLVGPAPTPPVPPTQRPLPAPGVPPPPTAGTGVVPAARPTPAPAPAPAAAAAPQAAPKAPAPAPASAPQQPPVAPAPKAPAPAQAPQPPAVAPAAAPVAPQ